jgi:hypothetical protein
MTTDEIIWELDQQIDRLQHARTLLAFEKASSENGSHLVVEANGSRTLHAISTLSAKPKSEPRPLAKSLAKPARREISAAGRARIALAQKARWKEFHRAQRQAYAKRKLTVA